ncbi:uncharacterized protein [Euwallacea fornicatus]|uniref:uncharacterized protein n=1 Tax=Euwallacea fornicatus TaxID=995702 RepID=UPI003390303E
MKRSFPIVEKLNLANNTVSDIIRHYKSEDRIFSLKQTEHPRAVNEREERFIINQVKKNPKISVPKLKGVTFASKFILKENCFWKDSNKELKSENLSVTVKCCGGLVMVWSHISSQGVGELSFIEDIIGVRRTFKFYQDNDPKHTAKIVQEWMLYSCPKVIKTAAQSPDLNLIENVWHYLDTKPFAVYDRSERMSY